MWAQPSLLGHLSQLLSASASGKAGDELWRRLPVRAQLHVNRADKSRGNRAQGFWALNFGLGSGYRVGEVLGLSPDKRWSRVAVLRILHKLKETKLFTQARARN